MLSSETSQLQLYFSSACVNTCSTVCCSSCPFAKGECNAPSVECVWIIAYAADQVNSSRTPDDADSCRKYSSSHLSLTPGIFTVHCPHAICYGFEVMRSHESPQHPFETFLTRFQQPPSTIICDNSCKLYQYVLNRKPSRFQNTNFFVDQFVWRGHAGCSSGYSLDKYTASDIATINSGVNEQANAGLQQIKGQIVYMKPENYVSCKAV